MKGIIVTFLIAFALLLVVDARRISVVKRQADPCDITQSDVPEECRSLFNYDSFFVAVLLADDFFGQYCNETCGRPLFDFLRGCDEATGSTNSTEFDFSCSRSASGVSCYESVLAHITYVFACTGEDILGGSCSSQCRDNLTMAYEEIGCCAFSYYALTAGELVASSLFSSCSDVPQTLCIGGASGETLSFPASSVAVDPLCEDLVEAVDSLCRQYLGLDPFLLAALTTPDVFCGGKCGQQVYDFKLQCDQRTGQENATLIDLFCATSATGTFCGNFLVASVTGNNPLLACTDFEEFKTCSASCRDAITLSRNIGGCCTDTLLEIFVGTLGTNVLYSACGLEGGETCVGAFSDAPIVVDPDVVDSEECSSLQESLPTTCLIYTSFEYLTFLAYANSQQFYQDFCLSECASPIYDYFVKCDAITSNNNATQIDFLCSKNGNGDPCVEIYSDSALFDVLENECSTLNSTTAVCSEECSQALQGSTRTWGCCFFTFVAVNFNSSFAEDVVEVCDLPSGELCVNNISGREDGSDAAVSSTIYSAVVAFVALIAVVA